MLNGLFYLSADNLKDRLLVRDWVTRMKNLPGPHVVVVGRTSPQAEAELFIAKRISALLSEEMVTNMPMGGNQRSLLKVDPQNRLHLRQDLFRDLFRQVNNLIITPWGESAEGPKVLRPETLLTALRETLTPQQTVLFPANGLSPLANPPQPVTQEAERDQLLKTYAEERSVVDLAFSLRPAWIASPTNYTELFSPQETN